METNIDTGLGRLIFLANFLDTVPKSRFDLDSWRSTTNEISDRVFFSKECGTTACAVGWACALPQFQALGLKFRHTYPVLSRKGKPDKGSWDAVEEFFDIGQEESAYLFLDTRYLESESGPSDVAARIRKFVLDRKIS